MKIYYKYADGPNVLCVSQSYYVDSVRCALCAWFRIYTYLYNHNMYNVNVYKYMYVRTMYV